MALHITDFFVFRKRTEPVDPETETLDQEFTEELPAARRSEITHGTFWWSHSPIEARMRQQGPTLAEFIERVTRAPIPSNCGECGGPLIPSKSGHDIICPDCDHPSFLPS